MCFNCLSCCTQTAETSWYHSKKKGFRNLVPLHSNWTSMVPSWRGNACRSHARAVWKTKSAFAWCFAEPSHPGMSCSNSPNLLFTLFSRGGKRGLNIILEFQFLFYTQNVIWDLISCFCMFQLKADSQDAISFPDRKLCPWTINSLLQNDALLGILSCVHLLASLEWDICLGSAS